MTYLNIKPNHIGETSPGHIFALREDDRLEDAIDRLTLSLAGYELAALPEERPLKDEDHQQEPVAFESAPALTYTARLRSLLPAFISQLYAMFSVDHVERGAASRLRELRRLLGGLFKAEKQNYAASLTHAVISNPELQTQIREDLGGEEALHRWEIRRDTYAGILPPAPRRETPKKLSAESAQKRPRTAAAVLTDRSGLFRLASIGTNTRASTPHARATTSASGAGLRLRAPAPIGLTPDQLRPQPSQQSHAMPQDEKSIDLLQKTWAALQSEHYVWDLLLMIAGLMTFSRDVRKAYAPP